MGITPSLIAGGASLIGGLSGLFGGGNSQPAPPPSYQFQNMGGADQGAMAGIAGLPQYNTWAQSLPYAQNITQNLVNNPYAGQYQQNANATANAGWGVGAGQIGGGMNLIGAGNSMLPYAQNILQTGFDPQNALHDRTQQQVTDTTRAGLSARGLTMSPYGAGVENKSLNDFNIDWQNQLLNRQNTAAQGAGYLTNSAGNAINLGQNVSTLGLQTLQNASALPYSTYNTIGGNQLGAYGQLGQFGQAAGTQANMPIQDYLAYLQAGNQASGVANQNYANQITAQNNQFNQGQTLGKNIGAGIQGIGNWYSGGGFGGFGGFSPSSAGQFGSPYAGPTRY